MLLIHLLFVVFAVIGHMGLCVASYNRTHGLAIPYRIVKLIDLPHRLAAVIGPVWLFWLLYSHPGRLDEPRSFWGDHRALFVYALACVAFAGWVSVKRLHRTVSPPSHAKLLANHTSEVNVAAQLGHWPVKGWSTRLLSRLPGNELVRLSIHEKRIEVPRLPQALEGLTITHLSDLHFCGKITPAYFQYLIDRANKFESDLIAITGDILEKEICYPWLADTLGRLKARLGVFFVLGNHDKRVADVGHLRRSLSDLGFFDLGSRAEIRRVGDVELLLSGNELPWFGPPPALPDLKNSPSVFSILLSHTPDQINWARRNGFDLMLAGHTHGGQIRFPVIGPVVCPSRYGVKYASGVFYVRPTLMHVSRGISGIDQLRFNCPPELTKLELRGPAVG